jgi:hypothetical protein
MKLGRKVDKLEFRFYVKKAQSNQVKTKSSDTEHLLLAQFNQGEIIEAEIVPNASVIDEMLGNKLTSVTAKTKSWLNELLNSRGVDFVHCSIDYAKRYAKTNFEKYLLDTINKNWAEVDIQKIQIKQIKTQQKHVQIKESELERQKQIEQENINRSEIEHKFIKLADVEQQKYIELANNVFNKYSVKLEKMNCNVDSLKLSVFAVSNNRFYNKSLETYIVSVLKMSISINDYLI